ncbi:hypothetical protein Ssi03_31130 [Sphaerisporangium siamense]|nr:hypothetical protein Ssi03_31130 [Sphaerisporangium siamense]
MVSRGWDMYLHTLDQYLTRFPGRFALVVYTPPARRIRDEPLWSVLERGLGLNGPVVRGDRVRLAPEGLDPIEGVADYVAPHFLGVRTGDGLYRFIEGSKSTVVIGHHIFSDSVDPADNERVWLGWLVALFEPDDSR